VRSEGAAEGCGQQGATKGCGRKVRSTGAVEGCGQQGATKGCGRKVRPKGAVNKVRPKGAVGRCGRKGARYALPNWRSGRRQSLMVEAPPVCAQDGFHERVMEHHRLFERSAGSTSGLDSGAVLRKIVCAPRTARQVVGERHRARGVQVSLDDLEQERRERTARHEASLPVYKIFDVTSGPGDTRRVVQWCASAGLRKWRWLRGNRAHL
jgi:hypothetical protein